MRLFLCEKPSQGKDIAKVLGANIRKDGYLNGGNDTVTWCFGHLLEMSPPDQYDDSLKSWSLESLPIVPQNWKMEVKKDAKKQFNTIGKLLKQCSEVIIATDADREGETIARSVLDMHKYSGSISRLWLSALDDASIKKALNSILPGSKTKSLYDSGMARQRADWLMGMNLTRAYTCIAKKHGGNSVLSVGRVQSPTLAMIVNRDREIANFKPKDHFSLEAFIDVDNGTFKATWQPEKSICDVDGHVIDKKIVQEIKKKCADKTGHISDAKTERKKEQAPLPYSLSALQQDASNILSFPAAKTLKVAQSLYETHKITSYPRTDCQYLPVSQHGDASNILNALSNSDTDMENLVPQADTSIMSRAFNDKKITAHHAIIPTQVAVNMGKLKADEKSLYDLIRRRYLAQFFPEFEYDQSKITCDIQGEVFSATGRITRIEGWKVVINTKANSKNKSDSDQILPAVAIHDPAHCQKLSLVNKQTKPPQHYTDATLISAMTNIGRDITDPNLKKILRETSGLGTEATRAGIIDTLLQRNFITRKGKKLLSAETGQNLIDHLPKQIIDPIVTAQWEQALDEIASGNGSEKIFTQHQSKFITDLITHVQSKSDGMSGLSTSSSTPEIEYECPNCTHQLIKKFSPKNKDYFWGCSDYPKCKTTFEDNKGKPVLKKPKISVVKKQASNTINKENNQVCPGCGSGFLIKRGGTQGHFMGCNTYPKCKYTQSC